MTENGTMLDKWLNEAEFYTRGLQNKLENILENTAPSTIDTGYAPVEKLAEFASIPNMIDRYINDMSHYAPWYARQNERAINKLRLINDGLKSLIGETIIRKFKVSTARYERVYEIIRTAVENIDDILGFDIKHNLAKQGRLEQLHFECNRVKMFVLGHILRDIALNILPTDSIHALFVRCGEKTLLTYCRDGEQDRIIPALNPDKTKPEIPLIEIRIKGGNQVLEHKLIGDFSEVAKENAHKFVGDLSVSIKELNPAPVIEYLKQNPECRSSATLWNVSKGIDPKELDDEIPF